MKKLIALLALLFVACGGPLDSEEDQIAQTEQAMTAYFSTTYTYGVSSDATRTRCTKANGGGTGQKCRVPFAKHITYATSGVEGVAPYDWVFTTGTAFTRLDYVLNTLGCTSPPCTDWTVQNVTGTAAIPQVTFKLGTCPGDPLTSNSIETFVCTSFNAASDVQLTESLPGNYYGWVQGMTVTIDKTHINQRTDSQNYGDKIWDRHEIMEHGLDRAAGLAAGIGSGSAFNVRPWSNSNLFTSSGFGTTSLYDFDGFLAGDVCRAKSFVNTSQTTFGEPSFYIRCNDN